MKQHSSEVLARELLAFAGIEVDGARPWDIRVHDKRFYRRALVDGALGLGESYMDGWWDCEAVDQFIGRLLRADLESHVKASIRLCLHTVIAKIFNLQTLRRALQVSEKHYGLDNDLYEAMLDSRMNYTCGYWKQATNLEDAQEAKLDLVCRKLNLKPGMKVLDLGCGWGGFAKFAVERYGVNVVGYNNSTEQVKLARKRCEGLPIEIRHEDYRNATGVFDRVTAMGLYEHVGYKNYRTFMQTVSRCLKDDGLCLLHMCGGNRTTSTANAWITKYIFFNGVTPSIRQIGTSMEKLFVMEDWHNFGPYYDRTLMAWCENFERAWPTLSRRYDERFRRMWRYYLLSCAGAFRVRDLQLWQIVMTKPGTPQPDCRFG